MPKLVCGWCSKNNDDVDVLIAGKNSCICNICVFDCVQRFALITSVEFENATTYCSICGLLSIGSSQKSEACSGAHICKSCLNLCLDIIKNKVRVEDNKSGNLIGELSPAAKEWSQLAEDARDSKQLLRDGQLWLQKNKTNAAAGNALVSLLAIKSTVSLLSIGQSWLTQYPDHNSAPAVTAALFVVAPSAKLSKSIQKYLNSSRNIRELSPIIEVVIKSPRHAGLYNEVERLLERNYADDSWEWIFATTSNQRSKRIERLIIKWLQLNVDNPKLPVLSLIALTHSPKIINLVFDWMRAGGRESEYASVSIRYLVRAVAKYNSELLPRVLRYTRAWLKANPDDENTASTYESLLWASRSKLDAGRAKQWYKEHQHNNEASYVLTALLEYADFCHAKPNEFLVKDSKLLLRDATYRRDKSRLVCALLRVKVDEEIVKWAEEAYESHGHLWMLISLLLYAPGAQAVAITEAAYSRWKNREHLEPEIVHALLKADHRHALALRRARVWLKRNPRNKWIKAIRPLVLAAS